MRLYDIPSRYQALLASIEDADGELTDDQAAAMSQLDADLADAVDGIGSVIVQLEHECRALDAEALRFSRRRAARMKTIDRLRAALKAAVEAGGGKVKGQRLSANVQLNSGPSCRYVGDPDDIPAEYRITETVVSPDRQRAIEEWERTGVAPGGFEITRGSHLRLR